jgi:hypothetical protein
LGDLNKIGFFWAVYVDVDVYEPTFVPLDVFEFYNLELPWLRVDVCDK